MARRKTKNTLRAARDAVNFGTDMEAKQNNGVAKKVQQRHAAPTPCIIFDEVNIITRSLICYSVIEVAEIMRISKAYVKRLLRRGDLKGMIVGSYWRIPAWSVQEYQEGCAARVVTYMARMRASGLEKYASGKIGPKRMRGPNDPKVAGLMAEQKLIGGMAS